MMKKLCIFSLVFIAAVCLFFLVSVQAQTKVIELKLAHYAADNHEGNLASKMFADAVEKRTNGQIKIKIFPNNALGSPPEVLEQNILGAIDMSLPTQGQLAKYVREIQLRHASVCLQRLCSGRTRSLTVKNFRTGQILN